MLPWLFEGAQGVKPAGLGRRGMVVPSSWAGPLWGQDSFLPLAVMGTLWLHHPRWGSHPPVRFESFSPAWPEGDGDKNVPATICPLWRCSQGCWE